MRKTSFGFSIKPTIILHKRHAFNSFFCPAVRSAGANCGPSFLRIALRVWKALNLVKVWFFLLYASICLAHSVRSRPLMIAFKQRSSFGCKSNIVQTSFLSMSSMSSLNGVTYCEVDVSGYGTSRSRYLVNLYE